MAKGCILTTVLPLRCFLFLLPNYIHVYAIIMESFSHLDKGEVLQQEYSQPPILPSPRFRWVAIPSVLLVQGAGCRDKGNNHHKLYLQNHFICLFILGVGTFMMLLGGENKHQDCDLW